MQEPSEIQLYDTSCNLIRLSNFDIYKERALSSLVEEKPAYILNDNRLYYVIQDDFYKIIPVWIPTDDKQLKQLDLLFPKATNGSISASKEALAQIAFVTGHNQILFNGNNPINYDPWGGYVSQIALATLYSEGKNTNYALAADHYLRASTEEHFTYGTTDEQWQQTKDLGMKYMHLAANEGGIGALKFLGTCYLIGNHVDINHQKAIDYFMKAIESLDQDDDRYFTKIDALNELISLYHKGIATQRLFDYFVSTAHQCPKTCLMLASHFKNRQEHQQALHYYSLYKAQVLATTERLTKLIAKTLKEFQRSGCRNYDERRRAHSHAEYYLESFQKEVISVDETIVLLKTKIDQIAIAENNLRIQAEENALIQEIKTAYEKEQTDFQESLSRFFKPKPLDFPKNPSLLSLIEQVFLGNELMLQALQKLNCLDDKGQLNDAAPKTFIRAFEDYVTHHGSSLKL